MRIALTVAILLAAATPSWADDMPSLTAEVVKTNWRDYVGQRVKLTGGKISTVKSKYEIAVYGMYRGATVPVDTKGMDAAVLAEAEGNCAAMNTNEIEACTYEVVGTLEQYGDKDKAILKNVEFIKP